MCYSLVSEPPAPLFYSLSLHDALPISTLFPMIRARLVEYNGEPVTDIGYAEGSRARRLAEREFNLSSAETLRPDNRVAEGRFWQDRKSTRLNSSHVKISYAVFCLKQKK